MVYKMRVKLNISLLLITSLMVSFMSLLAGCGGEEVGFGIYLVDNGELVLSERHIDAYYGDTHTIELNEDGIRKWNSYMTWETIPKQKDSLHNKDFALKIEGKEIYGGKFYSGASSMSYSGVVIMDAIIELDNDRNTIRIQFGYPAPTFGEGEDPRDAPEVIDFLEKQGLLR
ncbi:MAG: hypothetical protein JSV77_07400 [Dehalococcoidales bacterium]|nr:MAG: hypothetical protein JSV77_07400 [Dehalococcoidales bacterium]